MAVLWHDMQLIGRNELFPITAHFIIDKNSRLTNNKLVGDSCFSQFFQRIINIRNTKIVGNLLLRTKDKSITIICLLN